MEEAGAGFNKGYELVDFVTVDFSPKGGPPIF